MLSKLLSADGRAVLESIMRHVPSGLTLASAPDCTILRVSDYASELLGLPRSQLEGISAELHPEAYRVFDPSTGAPARAEDLPLTRAVMKGEVVFEEEWIVIDRFGDKVPIICSAGPILDNDGQILGGVVAWVDVRTQKQLQNTLAEIVSQRENLVRELHHRVKNQLQIIASIVQVEALRNGPQLTDFAKSIERRLDVLSAAHETSYKSKDLLALDAGEHLHRICQKLISPHCAVVVMTEAGLRLTTDQAIPLALIVNEAITNACKHGYPDGQSGRIEVVLKREGPERFVLTITDDGVGPTNPRGKGGFGRYLMTGLAHQLGGECYLRKGRRKGAVFSLCFPVVADWGSDPGHTFPPLRRLPAGETQP